MRNSINGHAARRCAVAVIVPPFQTDCVLHRIDSSFQLKNWQVHFTSMMASFVRSNRNDAAQEGCAVAVMALKFQADSVRQCTGYS
ncbi:hypothetical protein ANTPLA_LOCUS3098 [Anthophora plagiata]